MNSMQVVFCVTYICLRSITNIPLGTGELKHMFENHPEQYNYTNMEMNWKLYSLVRTSHENVQRSVIWHVYNHLDSFVSEYVMHDPG